MIMPPGFNVALLLWVLVKLPYSWQKVVIDDNASLTQCCPFSVDLHLAVALLAVGCDYYLLVIIMSVIDDCMTILNSGRPWVWQLKTLKENSLW